MIKTFILNSDSHVEIDIKAGENGKTVLTLKVDEICSKDQDLSELFGSKLIIPYLTKTIELGLMNEDYSWKPTVTLHQIALWVEICGEKIGQKIKWKDAENFWDKKNLRQARSKSVNEFGAVNGSEIIEACFNVSILYPKRIH